MTDIVDEGTPMTAEPPRPIKTEDVAKVREMMATLFPNPRAQIAVLLGRLLTVAKEEGLTHGQIAAQILINDVRKNTITNLVDVLRTIDDDYTQVTRTALRLAQSCYLIGNEAGQIDQTLSSVNVLGELLRGLNDQPKG